MFDTIDTWPQSKVLRVVASKFVSFAILVCTFLNSL